MTLSSHRVQETHMAVENQARNPFGAIRIVECGEGVSAAFGAKLLADLGADVIKIESPTGDLTRHRGPFPHSDPDPKKSGLFIYLNANKRGVVADLTRDDGRASLHNMLASADVLIHNVAPQQRAARGLDSAALCAAHPKLVVTSISMFGVMDRTPITEATSSTRPMLPAGHS